MGLIASGCAVTSGGNYIVTLDCVGPLILNLLTWLFTFAGIAALFFVIYGGFKFLTSGGDKEKVEGARKTITWALIGLILIFLSFAIVNFIGGVTGTTCIGNGSFKFGRCGLPENTCTDTTPNCPSGALPVCINNNWDCGDASGEPRP